MDLAKPDNLIKTNPFLNFFGGEYFARFLMFVLRFQKLNKFYKRVQNKSGLEFIEEVIKILELKIDLDENEVKRIPAEGPAIIVANHPLGGLDSLLLIKIVSSIRSDIKISASQLLKKVEPVADYFIDAHPVDFHAGTDESTFSGLTESENHLKNGGILCIFPAIEPTSFDTHNLVTDKIWRFPVIKFIKNMEVRIIPVLFQSGNSQFFKTMITIFPDLKNRKLTSEIFHKKNRNIRIRIGNPVKPADQEKFTDLYQFGRFLRAKTYGMATPIEVKRFFLNSPKPEAKKEPVIEPIPTEQILKEIHDIKDYLLFKVKEYNVFAVPSREIPQILNEIGRLREITFRDVGEGTNQSIDIDEFDLYYNQLFIWDEKESRIFAAYRIGPGKDIMEQYGKRGFYLNTLFRMDDSVSEMLRQSLEMGRSFVIKEYQKKPMSLFLLWKGILHFLIKHPEYRYLIGPVSISNNYSPVSKDLIVSFIMAYHFDHRLAQKVHPRNAYKFKSDDPYIRILMESTEHDIIKLDKIIGDVDAMNSGLPVLMKKYLQNNAKIVGFNVDPAFNNCLDGLIVMDVYDFPQSTLESMHKDIDDSSFMERYYSNKE